MDVTSEAYSWGSSNAGVATVASAYTNLVGVGNATGSATVQLQQQLARLNCPVTGFGPASPINSAAPTPSQQYIPQRAPGGRLPGLDVL